MLFSCRCCHMLLVFLVGDWFFCFPKIFHATPLFLFLKKCLHICTSPVGVGQFIFIPETYFHYSDQSFRSDVVNYSFATRSFEQKITKHQCPSVRWKVFSFVLPFNTRSKWQVYSILIPHHLLHSLDDVHWQLSTTIYLQLYHTEDQPELIIVAIIAYTM